MIKILNSTLIALLPLIVILAYTNIINADKLNNGDIINTMLYSTLYSRLIAINIYEMIVGVVVLLIT